MTIPLLTTKLHIPPLCSNGVKRPRLIEPLNLGLDRRLTLILASAGLGKTTLLNEWVGHLKATCFNAFKPAAPLAMYSNSIGS